MTVLVPKGVLFDLDGTLIRDTLPLYGRALREACQSFNVALDPAMNPSMADPELSQTLLETGAAVDSIANILRMRRERITALLEQETLPADGAQELLALLAAHNIPRGVVTDASKRYIDLIGKCIPLSVWFDGCPVITRSTLEQESLKRKPAPDSLLYAAGLLNMHPSSLVYIGDRRDDVYAAIGAGMQSCLVGTDIDYTLTILASQTAGSLHELFHRIVQ